MLRARQAEIKQALESAATPRRGFTIPTPDDTGYLRVGGSIQYRSSTSIRQDRPAGESVSSGTQFRRLRLKFDGELADGRVFYFLQGEANGPGFMRLFDAWVGYRFDDHWDIRAGQFILRFERSRFTSNARQLAVDRPIVVYEVDTTPGLRTQGIELRYRDDDNRASLQVTDGALGINTSALAQRADYAFSGRYDRRFLGEWSQFDSMTSPPGSELAVTAGFGFHVEQGEDNRDNRYAWAADVAVYGDGWVATLGYIGEIGEDVNNPGNPILAALEPEFVHAWYAEAGRYLTPEFEVFGRWELALASDDGDLHLLTTGFNWYIEGQALKLAADAILALEPVSPAFARPIDGLLLDTPGASGQVVFRAQLQLLF